jgi:F0F1-type ATP synthase delta subunit
MSAKLKISRRRIVETLVDMLAAGASNDHVAKMLAAYLVKNRQIRDLELYSRDIELAVATRFGVSTVYVTSARQLSEKVLDRIERLVKLSSGVKNIEMIEKRDPELIGGVIVRTADTELDGSIRTKLRNLRSI